MDTFRNHRRDRVVLGGRATGGFTIIELLLVLTLIGVLVGIALPTYRAHKERVKVADAIADLGGISARVKLYWEDARAYPDSLAELGLDTMRDPWGNPYRYLNLQTANSNAFARKNRALVPINTDFDLYSMGPDGRSVSPLTAAASQDDIVRANDGRYLGRAADY